MLPGRAARSVARLTEEPELPDSIPRQAMSTYNEIFSTVISPHPLIREGQLSVTSEFMDT